MFFICGEALFDMFLRPGDEENLRLDAVPGGSPFNVALGLVRLGQKAEFFSGLSCDLMGRKLANFMEREGIDFSHAIWSSHPTALSIVGLDDNGGPDYAFYGDFSAYRAITELDLPELTPDIRVIHIGSIATVLQPVGSALSALTTRESSSRLISYDPNVRPTIEPNIAVWRNVFERLRKTAHIIKVSAEDLTLLYAEQNHDDVARHLLDGNVRLVAITRGVKGAKGWTRAAAATQPPHAVKVVDTVGAGDSYQAALLAGLAELSCLEPDAIDGLSPQALSWLLDFAGQAAAFTCGRRGADLPHRKSLPV